MAVTIGAYSNVANPTGLDINSAPTRVINIAYGGVKTLSMSKRTGTYKPEALHALRFTWTALNSDELSVVRQAWSAAIVEYVTVTFDPIQIASDGSEISTVSAKVMSGTQLTVTYAQGYDDAGNGPLLFDVNAVFVTNPTIL